MEPFQIATPHIDPSAFIAPGTWIFGDVVIEAEAIIMFGTVIRAELDRITVGAQSNLQDNCVVHADETIPCSIGSRVTVGHAAVIHGATIGDHCLVGIGSHALNGSILGEGSWLAAGSVLTEGKEIPPWTLAMGSPARPVRMLTEAERHSQSEGIDTYLRLAATYTDLLGGD